MTNEQLEEDLTRALNMLRGSEVISRGGRYVAVEYTKAEFIKEQLEAARAYLAMTKGEQK